MTRLATALCLALALGPAIPAQAQDGPAPAEELTAGDLTISAPFARATLPNQPVGGGYLTIANAGPADRLRAAASPAAGTVEIHAMAIEGEVMRMRELADGLPIPPGETVTLEPGGYHLMFRDLAQPFVEGETVEVTLTFDAAGEVAVTLPILAPNAANPAAPAHPHHGAPDCAAQAPDADCPTGEEDE